MIDDTEIQLALDEKQDEILTGMPVPQDGKMGDIRTNVTHKGKFYQTMKTGIDTHFFSPPFTRTPSIHTMDDYLLRSGGRMLDDRRIYFRDTGLSIYSSVDGQLDIDADTELEITTNTLDINAAADISGTLIVGGAVTLSTIAAGEDNTVLISDAGVIKSDEIDSRVWGSSLVDYSGTPANNQIPTFTDVNTVQGEGGLTYDGSNLVVTGDIDPTGDINLDNGNAIGIGAALERLEFYTAGYALFTGCNLGIGIAPSVPLQVSGGQIRAQHIAENAEYVGLVLQNRDATATGEVDQSVSIHFWGRRTENSGSSYSNEGFAAIIAGKDSDYWAASGQADCDGNLQFWTQLNGTLTEKMRINSAGVIRMGTADANSTQFAADGLQTMVGTARVTNALWIPATGMRAAPGQPAEFVSHGISGAWQFTNGQTDGVVANIRIPNRMDRAVAPTITLGWSATATEEFCEWQVEYLWRSVGEQTTANAQDTLNSTDDADASTSQPVAEGFTLTTFTLALPTVNDVCLHLRIRRLADDELSTDAELHGLCMNFTSNKLGTAT